MSFTQEKIDRASVQSRAIFNNYVYRTNDTMAQVKAAGYFDKCRFAIEDGPASNGFGWNNGNIECYCSDGYMIGQMDALTNTLVSLLTAPTIVSQGDILVASSAANQIPGALGTPLQLAFGSQQVTPQFDLSSAGAMTCKVPGRYDFDFVAQAGRATGVGIVNLFLRILKNGVQIGNTSLARLDVASTIIPVTLHASLDLLASDVITVAIVQDTSGVASSGGLYSVTPAIGWFASPSSAVTISQLKTVV